MARLFAENPSNPTRALQLWQILICKAHNKQSTTFGQLAQMIGNRNARNIGHVLGRITLYCHQEDLPPLTTLVSNKQTARPSGGFINPDQDANLAAVFEFDWFGVYPPTPEQLEQAFQAGIEDFRALQPRSAAAGARE